MTAEKKAKERHIGVSDLRKLNKTVLRNEPDILIVNHGAEPVAAIVPYSLFMYWQEVRKRLNGESQNG